MRKLIIFDAMGVIYKTSDDVKDLLYPYLKQFNPNITFPKIEELYVELSLGKMSSERFFGEFGFAGDYPQIETRYLDSRLELDDGFLKAAKSLSVKYDLAMLSNDVSEWSKFLRDKFKLNKYFTDVIISGDVGLRKPAPEIFELIVKRNSRHPADCIFIDDNAKNLISAQSIGLETILFDRNLTEDGYQGHRAADFVEIVKTVKQIFE